MQLLYKLCLSPEKQHYFMVKGRYVFSGVIYNIACTAEEITFIKLLICVCCFCCLLSRSPQRNNQTGGESMRNSQQLYEQPKGLIRSLKKVENCRRHHPLLTILVCNVTLWASTAASVLSDIANEWLERHILSLSKGQVFCLVINKTNVQFKAFHCFKMGGQGINPKSLQARQTKKVRFTS